MATDNQEASEETGCTDYGCGCLWGLMVLAIAALLVLVPSSRSFSILSVVLVPPLLLLVPGAVLGFVARYSSWTPDTSRGLSVAGKSLLGFAVLCLVSAVGLTMRPGGFHLEEQVPPKGGTIGPVRIEKGNMRMSMEIEQQIEAGTGSRYQRWSFVTVELLDEKKEYLSSFGGEFWHYAGYNGDDWEEADEEYEATLRVPSPGTYYLRFQTEANVDVSALSPIGVELSENAWWGAPTPLQAAGYVAFFLGIILVVIPRSASSSAPELEVGTELEYEGRTWVVRDRAEYRYDDWRAEEWTLHAKGAGVNKPRYLEREYEEESRWEAWFWSTPMEVETLQCADEEGETSVDAYAAAHHELPEGIVYDGEKFRLHDSGTALRDSVSVPYHTYQESWKEEDGRSITIEGTPDETLDAVVTTPISVSDLRGTRLPDGHGWEFEFDEGEGEDI